MKKVILDTNFLIACIKQKIDFFEEIKFLGFSVLIPNKVIKELKKIIKSPKQKLADKKAAELALILIKLNKHKKIKLNSKNTDLAISQFANSRDNIIVATLDRKLKKMIKGNKMVIRNKTKLDII